MTGAVATLVVSHAIDKLGALAVIALALDAPVEGAGTARPRIPLAENVWVEIEIPKFGEPPPIAIDVHADAGAEVARAHARWLLAVLRENTVWAIEPAF